ncbi:hypothetical protein E2C01_074586 [Portunus trituberculatus]|uniref:Uncharacterized protein n=1 Tax=Portunus trituberculatus TaxID=210409 RepID=A0A5B7ICM2_PORTR|nr:hypothetical protein [Portunus trituberculatus]
MNMETRHGTERLKKYLIEVLSSLGRKKKVDSGDKELENDLKGIDV